ncbi:MAG: hypothetical protein GXX96_36260 [Planctomycetaceae bacterium]|nr:hypothetical protein [Planctomycetaceae bacterium]
MSSDEPTTGTTDPRRRILWLVLAHVVVGPIGAFLACFAGSPQTPWVAAFVGVVFSQTSLLAIWGSLGVSPWWQRLIGVVIGVAYLFLLLGVGISELDQETFIVVGLTTTFVAIPLLMVRLLRVAIHLDCFSVVSVASIQFSIRHLMILTFVVACLITIGKLVQPFAHGGLRFWLFWLAFMLSVVGILPVWFVLATKQPVLYSVGLVAVGACAGYCLARIGFVGEEGIWTTAAATEAMAVVGSLLIVRSCGYRLVRLPLRRQLSQDGAA